MHQRVKLWTLLKTINGNCLKRFESEYNLRLWLFFFFKHSESELQFCYILVINLSSFCVRLYSPKKAESWRFLLHTGLAASHASTCRRYFQCWDLMINCKQLLLSTIPVIAGFTEEITSPCTDEECEKKWRRGAWTGVKGFRLSPQSIHTYLSHYWRCK